MGYTPHDDGREVFETVFAEPLDGGDFRIRHWREEDVAAVLALVDDVIRDNLHLPEEWDAEGARPLLLNGGALAIDDAGTGEIHGGLRAFLHDDAVEFGYWLGAAARGRGLASRGLELVSRRVVEALRPSRLELRTGIGNEASERVAARAGYRRIGPEPPLEYPGGRVLESTLWIREL